MKTQRFNKVFALARSAKQALDARGSIKRNALPKVTLLEHDWLVKNHAKMAAFTRVFDYPENEYIEDTNRMSPSRLPKVTEIWVGARSLGCIPGESSETESEGLSASQMDQEDAAELTDLQTLLYHDPKSGLPLIEDEHTGLLRPIVTGDCITVVRGSNDDLDSLFLEEGDDPRTQNDSTAYGTDHRWSDRFRANTVLEESFLHDRSYRLPNSALPEELRWQPDDLTMRRLAQNLAARIIERNPDLEPQLLSLTDEAEKRLRNMASDLAFDHEGALVRGYFVTRDEFFGTIEQNLMSQDYERSAKVKDVLGHVHKVHRAAPPAVNWDEVRTPAQKQRRQKLAV